ncbi:MAG: nitroreductase family protein [Candidatus Brockarchaeota archaeon]|nr:nitroreductase family protein [Candidatus Brockarchaeota archaeon]
MRGRRSVRRFKPDPVPKRLLREVLEAASSAPSAGNLQSWEFVVVEDEATKEELSRAALGQSFVAEAPVSIVVCANQNRSSARYGRRGREFYSICDASAATQNLLLAAHGLGLGSCWVGAFEDELVSKVLGLPSGVKPVAIVPIGYPAEAPPPTPRLPLAEKVHARRYGGVPDPRLGIDSTS